MAKLNNRNKSPGRDEIFIIRRIQKKLESRRDEIVTARLFYPFK
jgi:hypothetical protein